MEQVVPWSELSALIELHYPQAGNGRPPAGLDSKTKMIHGVVATAANAAASTVLPELRHGEERKVWGDQAYRRQTEAMQEVAPGRRT